MRGKHFRHLSPKTSGGVCLGANSLKMEAENRCIPAQGEAAQPKTTFPVLPAPALLARGSLGAGEQNRLMARVDTALRKG